jgi:DNA processing protein
MQDDRLFKIALTLIPGVGHVLAKNLMAYCGSPEAVFQQKKSSLERIPGIGPATADKIRETQPLKRAEKELAFIEAKNIRLLFYLDDDYPQRLKSCTDSPVLLYFRGSGNLNPNRAVAMVGTRNATPYGKKAAEMLVHEMKAFGATVVSGLAYGIDITAHKAAVDNGVPTIGVLAHGLDRIYPSLHVKIAEQMLENGGLISEYPSGTNPDRENFPTRNRIIAGLSDAVVVVEAADKGGALITAELAMGYNREVFAVPGRIDDVYSEGCNRLIYLNQANMLRHGKDLEQFMRWETEPNLSAKKKQAALFVELTPQEEPVAHVLRESGKLHIETLCTRAAMPINQVLSTLFALEMKGAVRAHPGKVFEWVAG